MNKLKFFSAFLVIALSVVYIGCGDDATTNNNGGGNVTYPNIEMKKGAVFTFTVDTLSRVNGNPVRISNMTSTDTYVDTNRIGSNLVHTIRSVTDSAGVTSIDTNLVYYDATGGKFYHFGLTKLINSTITPTWDLIADFNLATGTYWSIPMNPNTIIISGFTITVNLSARIAELTTFQTTGTPTRDVPCYRIELKADLSLGTTPLGSILFDYYLGYNNGTTNSSGITRLKLRPVSIGVPPLSLTNYGVDRITATFNIP